MELVDVARTAADKKKEQEAYKENSVDDMPDYPYGLEIRLNSETLEKLKLGDLDAADGVMVMARGMVTEDSVTTINGKKRQHMVIQLQKIAITPADAENTAASTLYGDK